MRRFIETAAVMLLVLALSVPAFSQGFNATVSGTVTDTSGALIPGVTIKATAVDTGVVTNTVTNEAGAYSFALLPGRYTIGASLPGFQARTITDVQLSSTEPSRYNFQLAVSGVNTQVEVTVSAETILATQGATVGQVLTQQKVQDLPLVGNNILDLITVMAGVENIVPTNPPSAANAFGRENTTFAGVRADNISIVRDGIQMQDIRNPNGIYSVTTINPDLVGEIRLILAPVDVELGRGNGSIQYTTRSGTNRYSGSAVWSVRNTALDPNSWTNNRSQTIPPNQPADFVARAQQGLESLAVRPAWANTNQVTVSYGGPIVRNKTFFFALFDINRVRGRSLGNFVVPTPCARLGIYRYFNGWNNGNVNTQPTTGTTGIRPSVNLDGTPNAPASLPAGSTLNLGTGPYDGSLKAISVFGPMQAVALNNDCSNAPINKTTLIPNGVTVGAAPGAGGGWDRYRVQLDPSGYIPRVMAFYPLPNNFETGDGLNTAGYRMLRKYRGVDNLFGSGEATGDREQYNVKIDQNITANHKANFNVSYELVDSDDVFETMPGTFSNLNYRRPVVLSGGFTSTLSPTLLNEARFGMRRNGINIVAPWHRPEYEEELKGYFPAHVGGYKVITDFTAFGAGTLCNPHSGGRPPGSTCVGLTGTQYQKTPSFTFSDTISWTHGAHSFRFNGELRTNSTEDRNPSTAGFASKNASFLTVTGGSITGTGAGSNSVTDIAGTNPAMPGLLGTAPTGVTAAASAARGMATFLAGSLGNLQTQYNIVDPNDLTKWSGYLDGEFRVTQAKTTEFSAFAKDDWKITKNLTLTPGIRWDYYGTPYIASGLTIGLVGGGGSAFGVSGRDFTGWMNPGIRGDLTSFELVGPNSPNPDKSPYNASKTNFAPNFSFAYNLPWFGEGKTAIRGGYGITYQARGFGTVVGALSAAPGANFNANFTTQNVYVDLANLAPSLIPVPNVAPIQPLLVTGPRSASFTAFDPNYTSPYIQNLTLSITRQVSRSLTADVRYVGTLSRKGFTTTNLNINNFYYNGLLDALERVRTGTEITKTAVDPKGLLDQIFNGINLCTSTANPTNGSCPAGGSYGPIGSTVNGVFQSAAYQIRSGGLPASGTTSSLTSLAEAQYNTLAGTLETYNYPTSGSNASLPNPTGTVGAALRLNGFPENFINTNPQFGTMNLLTNNGHSNYHSFQGQVTMRPVQGISGSLTYNWSKNLGLLGTHFNPAERNLDYTNIGNNPAHSFRTYGTFELPIGPNKLLLGNSSGILARALEKWQLGLIWNISSGAPTSITATTMGYGNGLPDVRHPVDFNKIKGVRWGIRSGNNLEGRYFDNGELFVRVDDPLCSTVTNLQNLSGLVPATGAPSSRCGLDALAMVVPAGTPDSFPELGTAGVPTGRTLQVVLQHAQPGKRGNLGNNTVIGLGSWRFDANLGKTFRITESKSLQLRVDAQNVLNHPQPGNPSLSIEAANFGSIASKTGGRVMQAQLRLSF
jgi:hypothetical protein